MTNLSDNFGERASGLSTIDLHGVFGQFAGVSDGYTNASPDMSLSSTLDNTL